MPWLPMVHSHHQFFLNDLVCLKANPVIRGYVTHSNNIDEDITSDGEFTEGKDMKRRVRGLIKVRWLSSRSSELTPRSWVLASKLEVLDRVFRLGELVSSPKHDLYGTGRVIDFDSTVTIVNTLTGRIKEGVSQKDLRHYSQFDLDSSICILYQGWLGWIEKVEYRYVLKKEGASEDDAIVCVTNPHLLPKLRSQPTPFRGERFMAAGIEVGQRLFGRPCDFDRLAGISQKVSRKEGQINARVIRKTPRALDVIWAEKDLKGNFYWGFSFID
ncbi:hypothetical protein DSO57_1033200 [Entomophthora muscae]|uniref:Uncharacterized protein n=1 Tax=Entomophthora muscae TaxID=34485 RepID=A0ACC2RR18_9FUNG|nr:hypothetical protein DSO57_1033200 [Entomophthora muscae]